MNWYDLYKQADKEKSYSWVALELPDDVSKKIKGFQKQIDKKDLHIDKEDWHGYGIEKNPHITVKYGLYTNDGEEVKNAINEESGGEVLFSHLEIFENDEHDVLVMRFKSKDLARLHKLLKDNLENDESFPTYKPHATIAYFLKGKAKEYKKKAEEYFGDFGFKFDEIFFEDVDDKRTNIKLGKQKVAQPFMRSMCYAKNRGIGVKENWYRKAILDAQFKIEDGMEKEAGMKQSILAAILSLLSGIAAPYEAKAIREFLNRNNIPEQEVVSTINEQTNQNKEIEDININDIRSALEVLREKNDQLSEDIRVPPLKYPTKEKNEYVSVGNNLNVDQLKETIRKHEGKNKDWGKIYLDPSRKNYCVGYGFNVNKPNSKSILKSLGANYDSVLSGKQRLSETQIEKLLDISVKEAEGVSRKFISNYDQLPSQAKLVLVNMAFMGGGTLGKFNDFRAALMRKDYNKAADEMLDSLWAKQVGNRAKELANIMRSLKKSTV